MITRSRKNRRNQRRTASFRPDLLTSGPIPPRPPALGLAIVYEIPESAPAIVREGLARRRLVALGERCPCGAGLSRRQRRARAGIVSADVVHADGCPVLSPELAQYLASHVLRQISITFPVNRGQQ